MKEYTFRIIIKPDGDEFHAYVPSLPGCHTHGATVGEARANIRDAMTLYLSRLSEKNEIIPEEVSLESFETVPVHV